jgi:hypothetical protein
LLKLSSWGVAWKRGGIRAGDDSVEAAGQGGGLQAETGNCGQPGVGGNGKHTLGGSRVACLGGLAVGNAWEGRRWRAQAP